MNVPELFICPISLELFKDPVTLCTGLTYDRSSIQKWLAAGNLTCPVTMQKVDDPITMVPNHTLRHLITQWLQMGIHQQCDDSHFQMERATMDSLASLKHILESREFAFESKARALEKISSSTPSTNYYLLLQMGYLPLLVKLVFGPVVPESEALLLISCEDYYYTKFVELALSCVLMLLPVVGELECLKVLKRETKLSYFRILLAHGSALIRISLCRLIETISSSESTRELCCMLGKNGGILTQLVRLIFCQNNSEDEVADAVIRAISALSFIEENIESLVKYGVVNGLVTYISSTERRERSLAPLAMAAIERLLGVESAKQELLNSNCDIVNGRNGIHALVKMVFRVSWSENENENDHDHDHDHHQGSESAVASLLNVCNDSLSAREEAVNAGVLTQLLLLLQSQCSSSTKVKGRMLLKLLRNKRSQDSKQLFSMV